MGSTSPAHAPRKVLRKLNTITSTFRLTSEAEVISLLLLLFLLFYLFILYFGREIVLSSL